MRNNLRKMIIITGSVTFTIAVCLFFGFFGKNEEDVIINRIVGIVAIISGIGSLFMGISSIFSTSLDNVREYYATGDTVEMSKARYVLYNYRYIKMKYGKKISDPDFDEWAKGKTLQEETEINVTSTQEILDASGITINFFQMWGLLQSKGFLPMWVFETSSGYSILKLHEALVDILEEKRLTNPFYAQKFSELCDRIVKNNKKAIKQCRDNEKEYIESQLKIKAPWN